MLVPSPLAWWERTLYKVAVAPNDLPGWAQVLAAVVGGLQVHSLMGSLAACAMAGTSDTLPVTSALSLLTLAPFADGRLGASVEALLTAVIILCFLSVPLALGLSLRCATPNSACCTFPRRTSRGLLQASSISGICHQSNQDPGTLGPGHSCRVGGGAAPCRTAPYCCHSGLPFSASKPEQSGIYSQLYPCSMRNTA